jgi:hypothetical protein
LYLEIGQAAGQGLLVELGADPEIFTLVDTPAMAALEKQQKETGRLVSMS